MKGSRDSLRRRNGAYRALTHSMAHQLRVAIAATGKCIERRIVSEWTVFVSGPQSLVTPFSDMPST